MKKSTQIILVIVCIIVAMSIDGIFQAIEKTLWP